MMPTGLGHQEPSPLPRIVWSDLVRRKAGPKGAERRSDRKLPLASKLPAEAGSCSFGGTDGDMKPSWAYLEGIQEEERDAKWTPGPPRFPTENSPSLSSPEKHAVKTILVDLRPILEKVTESPDSGQEESLEDSPKEGSTSPQIGEYYGEGDLVDGRGEPGHGRGRGDAAMVGPKDEGIPKDLFLPPLRSCSLGPEGIRTPKGSRPWRKEATQIRKNSLPALVTLQPELSAPLVLPKMAPKEHSLVETDISAQTPAAPSPDVQLPTRLLLWRLQETTTSDNHLLIARVLSSMREELLADGGEKQRRVPELPRIQPFKAEGREKEPDGLKKQFHKFPKKHNRSFQGE